MSLQVRQFASLQSSKVCRLEILHLENTKNPKKLNSMNQDSLKMNGQQLTGAQGCMDSETW